MSPRSVLLVLAAWLPVAVLAGQDQARPTGETKAPALPPPLTPTQSPSATNERPLLLSAGEPLLLLDDGTETNTPPGWADNTRCQVCHLHLMQEALVAGHAKTNIGCATCHGPSDAHIADESWASGGPGTAPDIMFPRAKIYSACVVCHKPEQVFVKIEKHQPFWWSIAYQEKVCTECHGQHRIPNRKCKWK